MDRRLFISSAVAGAALLSFETLSASPAVAATAPPLPYEVSRISNVTTTSGGKVLYDNILVDIGGDKARIFLPQSIKRGSTTAVGAVWFHHGGGSSQDALNGGFKYPGELVVDNGAIAICINAGGTQYTNAYAQQCQVNAWKYLSALFTVRMNFLRPTSAGGALASYVYGRKLIPYLRGLYMVNGLYDLEWLYKKDTEKRSGLLLAFGNSPSKIAAGNPARIPASAWSGSNVKVLVSDAAHPDPTVDAKYNGLALLDLIKPVAADAQVRYHSSGHDTPSFAHKDMIASFAKWSGLY